MVQGKWDEEVAYKEQGGARSATPLVVGAAEYRVPCSLSFLSVAVRKKTHNKSNLEHKELLWLTFPGYSPSLRGSHGRDRGRLSGCIHGQEQRK